MCGSDNLDLAQNFIQDGNSYIAAAQPPCMFNTHNPPRVAASLDMPNRREPCGNSAIQWL